MLVVRGWLKTRYDPLGNGPAIGSAVDLGIRAHAAQLIAPTMDDRHNIIILLPLYTAVKPRLYNIITLVNVYDRRPAGRTREITSGRVPSFPYIVRLQVKNGFLRQHVYCAIIIERHPRKITYYRLTPVVIRRDSIRNHSAWGCSVI